MRKRRKVNENAQTGTVVLALAATASALGASSGASFAPHAQGLFLVFSALLTLHAARLLFGERWRAPGRGERTLIMSGRLAGAVAVLAAPLAVMSFWTAHDLTAEKIGREIDRSVAVIASVRPRD